MKIWERENEAIHEREKLKPEEPDQNKTEPEICPKRRKISLKHKGNNSLTFG